MQYQLRSNNEKEKNFNKHNRFTKRAQELEKYCTELTKSIDEEKSKMHSQLSKLELSKNIDNELTTNNDNDNELPKEFCSFRIAAYSLCFNAVRYNFVRISFSTKFVHYKLRNENEKNNELEKNFDTKSYNFRSQLQQQLPTVTFKKKKEQLDNLQNAANFYSAASKTKLQSRLGVQLQLQDADSALRGQLMRPLQRASTEACQEYRGFSLAASFRSRIDNQLPRQQLDRRALQQDSFQDSSLDRRALQQDNFPRQQLDRRDLPQDSFQDSSLADETFRRTTSETAASKTHFALATSQRAAWQISLEQPSFQRRTSSTELSEPERPALTTELAQLQTSSFQESSFELSFEEPSFIAQLCFKEASFTLLHGAQLSTAALRGGVLREELAVTLTSLSFRTLGLKLRQLTLERSLPPQSLALSEKRPRGQAYDLPGQVYDLPMLL